MTEHLSDSAKETPAPPPGLFIADHFHEDDAYHVQRKTGTKDWLITYTLNGEGIFLHSTGMQRCTRGDVTILSPGTAHDYATNKRQTWEFVWAHFLPRSGWARWLQLPQIDPGLFYIHIENTRIQQRIIRSFNRLLGDSRITSVFQQELAMNALEEVLLVTVQQYMKQATANLDPRIEEVLQYLASHLSEPLQVNDLAQTVSLSSSRLAHLFKEQVGDSIMRTLLKMRLQQAARLLEFTTRQINEIAHDVGFASPFYLTRQFKAYYGLNPTQYREKTQSKSN